MKKVILGFIVGCIMATSVSVFAATLTVTTNSYKVTIDDKEAKLEGYNINGNTYFKLRDVADAVGGFTVGFENNIITITKQQPNSKGDMRLDGQTGTPPNLDEMKTKLQQDVKDGKMTQAQADEMLKNMESGNMQPPNRDIAPKN